MNSEERIHPSVKTEEDSSVPKNDIGNDNGDKESDYHLENIVIANPITGFEVYCRDNTLEEYMRGYIVNYLLREYPEVRKKIDEYPDSLPEGIRRAIIQGQYCMEQKHIKEQLNKEDLLEIISVLEVLFTTFGLSPEMEKVYLELKRFA